MLLPLWSSWMAPYQYGLVIYYFLYSVCPRSSPARFLVCSVTSYLPKLNTHNNWDLKFRSSTTCTLLYTSYNTLYATMFGALCVCYFSKWPCFSYRNVLRHLCLLNGTVVTSNLWVVHKNLSQTVKLFKKYLVLKNNLWWKYNTVCLSHVSS